MSTRTRRSVPLLDLSAQHNPIRTRILEAVTRVLDSQRFILGEEVAALEREAAAYAGVSYAIGCASGTDALWLSLTALGVGEGDEVVTTPFTFFATAGAIVRTGATPVFADIEARTFNLDPERLREALDTHPRAKAVIPVHLFGGSAEMEPILAAASEHGCRVIEDAAQSIGAEYRGRQVLGLGATGCLSFFPSKNLGAAGDGGMVTTNDLELAAKLKALRVHGETEQYHHRWVGTNSRLDALQAAVLRVKLPYLDSWTMERQRNAGWYADRLSDPDLPVVLPRVARFQTRHVFNQFTIRCQRRDQLRGWLTERGVGNQIYYPIPLHLQECFRGLGYRAGDFPESERAAREVLSIPVAPGLSEEDIAHVSRSIREFYKRG